MKKVLIVEDDIALAKSLKAALEVKDYQIEVADCYNLAIRMFQHMTFDILVVDIQLPDGDGIELCEYIRKQSQLPILFLTANDNEEMLVKGLNSGGDDYMTKPLRIKELYARLQALLRRSQSLQDKMIVGNLQIDLQRREVFIEKQEVHLSTIDFDILKMLMIHKNQVLTRSQLLEAIDQENNFVEDNTLSVHVKRLRDKLGIYHGHSYIETVRGIGYRLNKEVLYEDE